MSAPGHVVIGNLPEVIIALSDASGMMGLSLLWTMESTICRNQSKVDSLTAALHLRGKIAPICYRMVCPKKQAVRRDGVLSRPNVTIHWIQLEDL
jgi:hypothetical protein